MAIKLLSAKKFATNLKATIQASGRLGFTADTFLTYLSLLMPAFSLPAGPPWLAPELRPGRKAPLPLVNTSPPLRHHA